MLEAVELPGGNTLIRGQTDVWSFDPQSRARTPFAKLTADSFRACGKYVVINALQQGVRRLLRFDLDGWNPTVLDSDNINSLACSPDGQFVFYSVQNSPQKILRASIQGGVPTEVFRTLNADLLGPIDVSHDGRHIAFCQTAGVPATQVQFVVMSTAGGPVLKTVAAASDFLRSTYPYAGPRTIGPSNTPWITAGLPTSSSSPLPVVHPNNSPTSPRVKYLASIGP